MKDATCDEVMYNNRLLNNLVETKKISDNLWFEYNLCNLSNLNITISAHTMKVRSTLEKKSENNRINKKETRVGGGQGP